jgi:hypothetical protein
MPPPEKPKGRPSCEVAASQNVVVAKHQRPLDNSASQPSQGRTLRSSSMNEEAARFPARYKRRQFIGEHQTPEHALTWRTAPQRSKKMFAWRCATMARFSTSARMLRVAWLLDCMSWKKGYAFATDSYISKELGIQLNNVQAALTELEQAGAIVRASVFLDGIPQRRIWPSTKIIPLTARGMNTPHGETQDPPHGKGTESVRKTHTQKTRRISTTQAAAKRDAERREEADHRRACEEATINRAGNTISIPRPCLLIGPGAMGLAPLDFSKFGITRIAIAAVTAPLAPLGLRGT